MAAMEKKTKTSKHMKCTANNTICPLYLQQLAFGDMLQLDWGHFSPTKNSLFLWNPQWYLSVVGYTPQKASILFIVTNDISKIPFLTQKKMYKLSLTVKYSKSPIRTLEKNNLTMLALQTYKYTFISYLKSINHKLYTAIAG